MLKKLKSIYALIPVKHQKKSVKYIALSIINIFLDLLSIAYIIPLFVFILDKNQMPEFFKSISFFSTSYIAYWVLGILVLFFLKNVAQIQIIKFQSRLVFNIATTLSSNQTKTFLKKPFKHIQHLDKGKEIRKIQMSGTDFANYILLSLNTMFTELTIINTIGVISLIFYPKLSLIIFFITLLALLFLYRIRKNNIHVISTSIKKYYSEATSHLLNIIDGFLEIKSLKKEAFFQENYDKTLGAFNDNFAILKKHQNSNSKYLEIFIILCLSLFLYFIHLNFGEANSKIVLISYVTGISLKLFPSLNKLIVAYTNFKSYSYTLDILSENETEPLKNEINFTFKSQLSLKNIAFSYNKEQRLLQNVNLELNRGEIVGIKGRSGIGKTTLLNIVMGFITPIKGELKIDDKVINNNASILPFIAYVPQQPFLFQGSVLDNIVMGTTENNINYDTIETLIKAFDLTSFISNLNNGLNTKISHNSLSVSGGQKQRIALIRALYNKPQLLILDEVTNQLDEDLELKILNYLKHYAKTKNIAILLVSHSIAISKICDKTHHIEGYTLKPLN